MRENQFYRDPQPSLIKEQGLIHCALPRISQEIRNTPRGKRRTHKRLLLQFHATRLYAAGMSQKQIARLFGICAANMHHILYGAIRMGGFGGYSFWNPTISKVMNGKRLKPPIPDIFDWAGVTGIPSR